MTTDQPRAPRTGSPWAVALGAAAAVAVLYGVFVVWAPGQRLDHAVYLALVDSGSVTGPAAGVVRPYAPQVLAVAAAVLAAAALRRGRVRAVVASVLVVVLSVPVTWTLRHLLTRPDHGMDSFVANSFPSGHVAAAVALAVACVLLWPASDRRVPAVLGGLLAAATALASVVVHAHLPVDVVAAPLVVTAVACAVLRVVRPPGPAGLSR